MEAAQASLEPTEIEATRLQCDTRLTRERIQWLQQYRSTDAPYQSQDRQPSGDLNNDMM